MDWVSIYVAGNTNSIGVILDPKKQTSGSADVVVALLVVVAASW